MRQWWYVKESICADCNEILKFFFYILMQDLWLLFFSGLEPLCLLRAWLILFFVSNQTSESKNSRAASSRGFKSDSQCRSVTKENQCHLEKFLVAITRVVFMKLLFKKCNDISSFCYLLYDCRVFCCCLVLCLINFHSRRF